MYTTTPGIPYRWDARWPQEQATDPNLTQEIPVTYHPDFMPTQPTANKGHRKTYILLTVIGVIVLLCVLGSVILAATSGDKPKSELKARPATSVASAPAAATTAPKAAVVGLGSKVRDGKFEFVATNLQCGVDIPNVQPQGQYCAMDLSIKNISKAPQSFFDTNQFAIGTKGEKYAADGTAGISANVDRQAIWLAQINPGNAISGRVVWDIPKTAKIVRFELHDSAYSGGVKVQAVPAS